MVEDIDLVQKLIKKQFPQWKHLEIVPVKESGSANKTFRLGDEMNVRLPVAFEHSLQVEKEAFWLPKLKQHISLPIPIPLAKGEPDEGYPFCWSVNQWLDGETLQYSHSVDKNNLAIELSKFILELEVINSFDGPLPGPGKHNFFRGDKLTVYSAQIKKSLDRLNSLIDTKKCKEIWQNAIQSEWINKPVWFHGDIAPNNLLVKNGILCGVIDFGIMGVGDPAIDLTMAWTFFEGESRETFINSVGFDKETLSRARGLVLWMALTSYDWNPKKSERAKWGLQMLETIFNEYDCSK